MLSTGIQALGLLVKMYILKETKKKSCHVLMYCRIYRDHYMHSVYFFTLFAYSILQATVHILPEVNLPSHPEGALWSCYHKFGCQATTAGSLEKPYQVSSGKNRLGKTRYRKVSFWNEVEGSGEFVTSIRFFLKVHVDYSWPHCRSFTTYCPPKSLHFKQPLLTQTDTETSCSLTVIWCQIKKPK